MESITSTAVSGERARSGQGTGRLMSWAVIAAMTVAMPCAAFAADAAAPKHTKKEVEVKSVAQTDLTKAAAPSKEKKPSGPTMTLDEFQERKQGKIMELNEKLIKKNQQLIRLTDDNDPDKPDLYFRLGELYAEQYLGSTFRARGLDQKIFEAKGTPRQAQLESQQKKYEEDAKGWLIKAVEQYSSVRKYKKFARQDENLFRLGYLLQMVKAEEKAREVFLQLIKDYPSSKYVPEAYLSFGEYFFGNGEMDNALKFYRKVAEFPKSLVYGYAIYKQAWCHVNLGDYKKALETFKQVIDIAREGKHGDKRQNAALEREARKDLVRAYAHVGSADKAWEFFVRVGGKENAPKMMELLGEVYWEQGQFVDSTHVYRKLIDLDKQSPRLCEWQGKIFRNTLSSGNKTDQVKELGRLGLAYDAVMKSAAKADVKQECRNGFYETSRELALIWHKEAQKTKNASTYGLVKYVYKVHLDHFSNEKNAVEMAFYYGEVLWVTEDWREAAEQYTKVVKMDPKGQYVRESAYAAVLAWKNALNIDDQGQGPEKRDDKDLKPVAIPEYQKKMIAAFDTYIQYVPNPPDKRELVKIKYRKARIFYEYNHFEDAAKYFQDIVENHPDDELAIYSANLLLDSYNAMKRPRDVLAWVEKFMATPQLMKDQEFATEMTRLRTESLDIEAQQYAENRQYKLCGLRYLDAADSLPNHPRNPTRLFNAGMCFTNAKLIGQAVAVRSLLVNNYPKDPLAQKALYQIGANYQQIASYENSAANFEKFAKQFPGEKMAPQAMANAYQFRLGLGQYGQAVTNMNDYIKFFAGKKPSDAAAKFFAMSEVYERDGKNEELAKHLDAYIKKWGKDGGIDRLIWAHFKLGELKWKRACPKSGVNGACIEIERLAATGRAKAFYDINKKITDKKKKLKDKGRTQCGPPTQSKITIYERGPTLAGEAQGHFATVVKLFGSGASVDKIVDESPEVADARKVNARYAAAGAAFYQAEKIYEDFLKIKFPEGIELQKPESWERGYKRKLEKFKAEEKRFNGYFDQKSALLTKLAPSGKKGLYHNVLDYKIAHWTIAASARIGQVYANFVDQLYTAPIPRNLKENANGIDQKQIFCDTLEDKTEQIELKAVAGYDLCLKAATEQSWFNEWSNMCEVELNQLKPSEYPLAVEARPQPEYVSTVLSPAGVTTELPDNVAVAPAKAQ